MTSLPDIRPLAGKDTKRLYFLDNLRIALTILVIAHHVGQAYGPTGGGWPIQELERARILGPFFTVNRSFFMSFFFLISGYLMVMSYDRSRPGAFVKARLLRLGVPLVTFFFLIIALVQYVGHRASGDLGPLSFGRYYLDHYLGFAGNPEMNFGHLWYIEHLLIVSLCYAALRTLWRRSPVVRPPTVGGLAPDGGSPLQAKPPGNLTIVLFALALACVSATVRHWYPIDRWMGFLVLIQVAFADVPRDLSFFILGAIAYRRQWFLGLPERTGRTWLPVGITLAGLWYAYSLGLRQIFPISGAAMGIVYPIWESLLCCGLCIGLLVLFREKLNYQGRWTKAMAEGQYAAYLFHVPVIVAIQFAVLGIELPPFAKFLLVTTLGVPLTFLIANWMRRPTLLRKIL
jgi:glucan biosynthesis protein C